MPEPIFEIYKGAAGKFRFRLRAPNGEIIATGEAYESKDACKKGIEAVKKTAPEARIIDLTKEIQKDVKEIRRTQTIQQKESLKSLYIGVLLGALIGVVGNFFVSYYFQFYQTRNTSNLIGFIVSGLFLLLISISLYYQARGYHLIQFS